MASLTAQLTFRVPDEIYNELQEIAGKERRKMNEAARALLERGLAAYKRDAKLFEPEGIAANAEIPATIRVQTVTLGSKGGSKKKRA